jgi:hypothetical protein
LPPAHWSRRPLPGSRSKILALVARRTCKAWSCFETWLSADNRLQVPKSGFGPSSCGTCFAVKILEMVPPGLVHC